MTGQLLGTKDHFQRLVCCGQLQGKAFGKQIRRQQQNPHRRSDSRGAANGELTVKVTSPGSFLQGAATI